MALEDMDVEEERKIHAAAQDEAAELVWKHRNPKAAAEIVVAPYPNPDIKKDYRGHLRQGSYQRSHSREAPPVGAQRRSASGQSSASGGSQDEDLSGSMSSSKRRRSIDVLRKVSPPLADMAMRKTRRTPSGKSYGDLAEAVKQDVAHAHRRSSSGSKRILSGEKKMFMHPNDRIWEDPQEDQAPVKPVVEPQRPAVVPSPVPTYTRKNPFARVRMQAEKLERANSEPIVPTVPVRNNTIEIQKNAPSQSKRPWYMSNEPLPPTPPRTADGDADEVAPKTTPTKNGKEIRGDDIRAATSKQRKDYSPKLPRPTVVSDKPGWPIVSFKDDWKPREVVMEEMRASPGAGSPSRPGSGMLRRAETEPAVHSVPQIVVDNGTSPPIPTIVLPDEPTIPSIVLPEEPVFAEPEGMQSAPATPMISVCPPSISVQPPTINVSGPELSRSHPAPHSQRRQQPPARPLPHHAATSPLPKSMPHYTPSMRQSGALCAHCALPIAGRVLSAAGQRFHPSCFVCHQCHTNLELVAFYPEPENKRDERLERIEARQMGIYIPLPEGLTEEEAYNLEVEDGDPSLRFYCHLDFHELFSPRCKSCKTPIEGEVIVACGAEWHAGHFFCAQCGDPFDSSTPFVEKDGYAWCVGCHTNRYSSKCRKCRKPVTETVVKALGHDWHAACFVCIVSSIHLFDSCCGSANVCRNATANSRMADTSYAVIRKIRSVWHVKSGG